MTNAEEAYRPMLGVLVEEVGVGEGSQNKAMGGECR